LYYYKINSELVVFVEHRNKMKEVALHTFLIDGINLWPVTNVRQQDCHFHHCNHNLLLIQ